MCVCVCVCVCACVCVCVCVCVMVGPQHTGANSLLAFNIIYTNHQFLCMDDDCCLLCMFVLAVCLFVL